MMRTGLRLFLENQPDTAVVGEAADGKEALAVASQVQPDIILLDLDLNGESVLDLIPMLFAVARVFQVAPHPDDGEARHPQPGPGACKAPHSAVGGDDRPSGELLRGGWSARRRAWSSPEAFAARFLLTTDIPL